MPTPTSTSTPSVPTSSVSSTDSRVTLLQRHRTIQQALGERSLKDFVVQAWPVVEPNTPFVDGWHLDAICDHLEACVDGRVRNLVINIPPRCMKSLLVG